MPKFERITPTGKKRPKPPRPDVFDELLDADLIEEGSAVERAIDLTTEAMPEEEPKMSKLDIGAATHASIEHPDRNEDANFTSIDRGIIFVADGMGGVPAGDQAAADAAYQLTRKGLKDWVEDSSGLDRLNAKDAAKVFLAKRNAVLDRTDVEDAVRNMIMRMNDRVQTLKSYDVIRKASAEHFQKELGAAYDPKNPKHARIMEQLLQTVGCTATFSKVWRGKDGKDRVTIGQIGDSRVYRLRDGKLEKLTRDDSHIQALIEEGAIKNDQDLEQEIDAQTIIKLAKRRKEFLPLVARMKSRGETVVTVGKVRNMITQAIGLEALAKQEYGIAFKPRVSTYELEDGDVLLTCSDGIHDNLTDEEIREILEQHSDPVTMAIALQDRATTRTILEDSDRAKPDDATALVMKYTRKEAKTAVKKAA